MTAPVAGGRVNQKMRTRNAIVEACRGLLSRGLPITMPAVARASLVSEATAYRYFPDLRSLLGEATRSTWPDPAAALEPVAGSTDVAERVEFATKVLMQHVLDFEAGVRATIAATVNRPRSVAAVRPGFRFRLIDAALEPLQHVEPTPDPELIALLRRSLAIVISAESLFTLIDLCGLTPEDAIATAASTAGTLTRAVITR